MLDAPAPAGEIANGGYRRIVALDVLRGVAILGILVMNIRNFALPLGEFQRPSVAGGLSVGNVAAWAIADVLFEDKMIALLSLLFGAGLVLMDEHAGARGETLARRWFARFFWLLLFGVIHALAVWYGDILNTYAIAGLLLFFVRSWSARRLVWLGILVLAIFPAISTVRMVRKGDPPVESLRSALSKPLPPLVADPPPAEEEVALSDSYTDAVAWHAKIFFAWHVEGAYLFNLWRCAGLMLFGMALAKVRFFAGEAKRLRRRLLWIGYGLGLPLALIVVATLFARDLRVARVELPFEATALAWPLFLRTWFQYLSGILLGLAHAALLVGWVERGTAPALQARFAAAGRMALSNYLVQSLVCTALFYGWGFGLFGRLSMLALTGVVVAIATVQLFTSPWWLARFAMGPFEWLWRSLTLRRVLPFRREAVVATA